MDIFSNKAISFLDFFFSFLILLTKISDLLSIKNALQKCICWTRVAITINRDTVWVHYTWKIWKKISDMPCDCLITLWDTKNVHFWLIFGLAQIKFVTVKFVNHWVKIVGKRVLEEWNFYFLANLFIVINKVSKFNIF